MLANILTAAGITPGGTAGDRDTTRRSDGVIGNEDFSSILARCTGAGEHPARGQTGEYTEHAQSVQDFHRSRREYTEFGQEDRGEPPAYQSGMTERSEATERSEEVPSGTTEHSEATEGDRPKGESPFRESPYGRDPSGEVPSGTTKRSERYPAGKVALHKMAFGNEKGGIKARPALRVQASSTLSMAIRRRGGQEKEELNPRVRKEQTGSVRELLEKLSWRRGFSSGRAQDSGQVFRGVAAVKIAAQRQKSGNTPKQVDDTVQRKTEDPRRLGGHARLRMEGEKGSGSIHWTVRRAVSEIRSIAMERERLTGGKEQAGVQRLPDTVLSRYEESVRSVDTKSNYQNLKNADGNFNEVVRQFNILVRNGGGEARMVLEPEHLGHLRLRIQLDRGEVTTNMVVDNQAVKDLIMSRLNMLEESLLKHGFGVGSFEVGVKGENAEGDQSSAKAPSRKSFSTVNQVENPIPGEGVQGQYLPWISSRVNITV